jgi:hypothetical protein
MGKRTDKANARKAKGEAERMENMKKRIAQAQSHVMPGQHVLTCGTCGIMGIYPIYQQKVTHMISPRTKAHPGEVTGLRF